MKPQTVNPQKWQIHDLINDNEAFISEKDSSTVDIYITIIYQS